MEWVPAAPRAALLHLLRELLDELLLLLLHVLRRLLDGLRGLRRRPRVPAAPQPWCIEGG